MNSVHDAKGKSLKTKILRILIISIVVFSAVLVAAVVIGTRKQMKSYFSDDLNTKYDAFTADLEAKATEINNQMQIFIESGSLQWRITNVPADQTEAYMTKEQVACDVSGIYVVDSMGAILFATADAPHRDVDFSKNTIFQDALANKYAQGFTIIGKDVEYLVVKLNNQSDNSTYVVCEYIFTLDSSVEYYHHLLGCEFSVYIGDTSTATSLTDANGAYLTDLKINNKKITDTAYSDEPPVDETTAAEVPGDNAEQGDGAENNGQNAEQEVPVVKAYHGVTYRGQSMVNGDSYISVYSSINFADDSQKAMFFIGKPMTLVNNVNWSVMKLAIPTIVIASSIFIIGILLMFLSLIMRPLSGAERAIHNLAQETDDADLTYRIEVKSDDEIGNLCKDINTFLDRLQLIMKDLKRAESALETIGMNLDTQSQGAADATTEIMNSMESVRNQTNDQRHVAESANKAMELSASNVDTLDGLIENQSAGITESSASIEEMIGNINAVTASVQKMSIQFKKLMEVTQTGNECQKEVNNQVSEMAEQSRLLSEANTVISRIASQTNLLAMNAAIEAAHAGKAGAGFSVVADEIRKLAETSGKQSHAIGEQLKKITGTISAVVSSSEQSKSAFGTITENIADTDNLVNEIDRAMTEQSSASKQVLSALHDVNSSTANVRTTAKEMKEEIKNVQTGMQNLKRITDSVSNGMDNMGTKTAEVNKSAHTVSDLAAHAKTNIVAVQNVVGKFKI